MHKLEFFNNAIWFALYNCVAITTIFAIFVFCYNSWLHNHGVQSGWPGALWNLIRLSISMQLCKCLLFCWKYNWLWHCMIAFFTLHFPILILNDYLWLFRLSLMCNYADMYCFYNIFPHATFNTRLSKPIVALYQYWTIIVHKTLLMLLILQHCCNRKTVLHTFDAL